MVTIWKQNFLSDEWSEMMNELGLPQSTFRFSIDPTSITDYEAEFSKEKENEEGKVEV